MIVTDLGFHLGMRVTHSQEKGVLILNRFQRVILAGLVLSSSIFLVGCDPLTFHRASKNMGTYLFNGNVLLTGEYAIKLSLLFDGISEDISLHMELDEPHTVWIEQNGTKTELGNLAYQFPDAPAKTMVLSINDDYFLVGWIDRSVADTLEQINVSSAGKSERWFPTKAFTTNPQMRIFHLPIYLEDGWGSVDRISIRTIETMVARIDDQYAPLYEFDIEYEPPIPWTEVDSWAVPIAVNEIK